MGVATDAAGPSAPGSEAPAGPGAGTDTDTGSGSDSGSGDGPGPATQLNVRRTGGFAGRTLERTVVLGELPNGDARAWTTACADDGLPTLAGEVAGQAAPARHLLLRPALRDPADRPRAARARAARRRALAVRAHLADRPRPPADPGPAH